MKAHRNRVPTDARGSRRRQRFRDRGGLRSGWRGRAALFTGSAAVMVAAFGLMVGSVVAVVVALTAIGASAGMWVTHRFGP